MPSKSLTRAAIYARVSTVDKGQDVENQLLQLREYTERQGWKIIHEYTDQRSGKNADRDQFKAMFEDASKRKFDVVLCWALDRFTREGILETFEHIRRLTHYGVQFESYTEPHFRTTGPAGELMLAIAAWIAKQERLHISERTKAGLQRARAAGVRFGRPKRIFDRFKVLELHEQGLSYAKIGAECGISAATAMRTVHSHLGLDSSLDQEQQPV